MARVELDGQTGDVIPRSFTTSEIDQIKELKLFMSTASNVWTWNALRDEAKRKYGERIISAVDALRKWVIVYDKPSKKVNFFGVKFNPA